MCLRCSRSVVSDSPTPADFGQALLSLGILEPVLGDAASSQDPCAPRDQTLVSCVQADSSP